MPVFSYSYDQEVITPYSYDVYLDEENIEVSFGVSHQAGIYHIGYEKEEDKYLMINNRNGKISIDKNAVSGFQILSDNGTKVYLYLEVEQSVAESGILKDGVIGDRQDAEGKNECAVLKFSGNENLVKVRYGISFISEAQAKKNLYRELSGFDKDEVVQKGR